MAELKYGTRATYRGHPVIIVGSDASGWNDDSILIQGYPSGWFPSESSQRWIEHLQDKLLPEERYWWVSLDNLSNIKPAKKKVFK